MPGLCGKDITYRQDTRWNSGGDGIMDLKLMIGIGFSIAGLITVIMFTQGAAFLGIDR